MYDTDGESSMRDGTNTKNLGERPPCPRCGAKNPKGGGKNFWICRSCKRSFCKNPIIKKPIILNINDYWLGWLAGIIDGEGTLECNKAKSKKQRRGFYWRFRCRISNTKMEMFRILDKILGDNFYISKAKKRKGCIIVYTARLNHQLLRQLLPKLSLVIKEKQRILLIEGLKLMEEHWGTKTMSYTPNDERLEEIYYSLKILNKRGTD